MKIWLVNLESCVDGEVFFKAVPCKDEDSAKEILKNEKENIFKECIHYKDLTDEDIKEYFSVEEDENSYGIYDNTDSYYEYYSIEETEIFEFKKRKSSKWQSKK